MLGLDGLLGRGLLLDGIESLSYSTGWTFIVAVDGVRFLAAGLLGALRFDRILKFFFLYLLLK